MDASQRRREILELLQNNRQPVSAGSIAAKYGVSRQIIVNDIALLRAGGASVSATPRGYILQTGEPSGQVLRTIACRHDRNRLADELYLVVDNGGGLVDVTVEHPVYGQISGQLHIFSRYDADCFLKKLEASNAGPLCNLTGGVHLHTLSCPSQEAYARIAEILRGEGILFESEDLDR